MNQQEFTAVIAIVSSVLLLGLIGTGCCLFYLHDRQQRLRQTLLQRRSHRQNDGTTRRQAHNRATQHFTADGTPMMIVTPNRGATPQSFTSATNTLPSTRQEPGGGNFQSLPPTSWSLNHLNLQPTGPDGNGVKMGASAGIGVNLGPPGITIQGMHAEMPAAKSGMLYVRDSIIAVDGVVRSLKPQSAHNT